MALPCHHLQYYSSGHLIIIIISFTLTFSASAINGQYSSTNTACPPFKCGTGFTFKYPFWRGVQPCGYPGLNLSCDDQYPTIHLPRSNTNYLINQVDYSSKSLTLSYTQLLSDPSCPSVPNILGLDITAADSNSSAFSYRKGNKIMHLFYNCTLYPPSSQDIVCLAYGDKRSYVFAEGAIPEFDWRKYCESVVVVPVIDEALPEGNNDNLVANFAAALRGGFRATWKQPDRAACGSCEASGGLCAFGDYGQRLNFSCICSDGVIRHSVDCYENKEGGIRVSSTGPIRAEPKFVAYGAVIFGGLIIAATLFYFVLKKNKFGSYKPV